MTTPLIQFLHVDLPGDFVPDIIEALFLFASLAVAVMVVLSNPRQRPDPYAALEEQALKFSHKKQDAPAPQDRSTGASAPRTAEDRGRGKIVPKSDPGKGSD